MKICHAGWEHTRKEGFKLPGIELKLIWLRLGVYIPEKNVPVLRSWHLALSPGWCGGSFLTYQYLHYYLSCFSCWGEPARPWKVDLFCFIWALNKCSALHWMKCWWLLHLTLMIRNVPLSKTSAPEGCIDGRDQSSPTGEQRTGTFFSLFSAPRHKWALKKILAWNSALR